MQKWSQLSPTTTRIPELTPRVLCFSIQVYCNAKWPQDLKRSVSIPIPKKGNVKECSDYHTIALISYTSKVMLKILQKQGYTSTWTENFQMFKLDLGKAEELEIKLPTSAGSQKKIVPEKHQLLLYWLCQSLWLCGSQQTGKFFKRWEYQTTDLPLEKPVCRSGSKR